MLWLFDEISIFYSFAGFQSGPTANSRTITLKKAFEGLPEAIDPALSKQNQDKSPKRTALRTASGALSYPHTERNQIMTPHPKRNPPVRAERNLVSGD